MIKSLSLGYEDCFDEELLRVVRESGFQGVDLGLYNVALPDEKTWEKNILNTRENLEKADLSVAQTHLNFYSLFLSSELDDEMASKRIHWGIQATAMLGAKWGAYHPMTAFNFNCDRERSVADNQEKLKRFLETAEKYGAGIAVENIPIFPDCPQHKFFSGYPEELIAVVDGLDSDKIGVCWDFGHANLMRNWGVEMADSLEKIGNRVKIVHMHNNRYPIGDEHLCPQIGSVDWQEALPILKKHGYSGPFNLEINLSTKGKNASSLGDFRYDYIRFCGLAADRLVEIWEKA